MLKVFIVIIISILQPQKLDLKQVNTGQSCGSFCDESIDINDQQIISKR